MSGGAPGSGAMALVLFAVMAVFTVWFSNFVLRSIDVLYKPNVRRWVHNKGPMCEQDSHKDICEIDILGQAAKTRPPLPTTPDDDYIKLLEEELIVLRAMRDKLDAKRIPEKKSSAPVGTCNLMTFVFEIEHQNVCKKNEGPRR